MNFAIHWSKHGKSLKPTKLPHVLFMSLALDMSGDVWEGQTYMVIMLIVN